MKLNKTKNYLNITELSIKLDLVNKNTNKPATYILRFWEKKFNFIKPKKNQTGRRYYSNQDIVNLEIIKDLLHNKGYTIAGAIKHMKNNDQLDYKNKKDHFNESNETLLKKIEETSDLILIAKNILNKY